LVVVDVTVTTGEEVVVVGSWDGPAEANCIAKGEVEAGVAVASLAACCTPDNEVIADSSLLSLFWLLLLLLLQISVMVTFTDKAIVVGSLFDVGDQAESDGLQLKGLKVMSHSRVWSAQTVNSK
jgi:hypothetical protein